MNEAAFHLSAANWQQVQDLLAEALDRPPDERTAFLRWACGHDSVLYREVASLLMAYADAGDFLDALDTDRAAVLLAESEGSEIGHEVGRYRILQPLGRGGMGIVYLAEDTRLRRQVALKFLPPHLAADEASVQRLFVEARAAAALDHPHIAVVHEIGETEPASGETGRPFIAMAYYEGATLREKIQSGPLPVEETLRLTRQIADGLRAAHRQGIVHLDVKPSNILVTHGGTVKIVDFGIARLTTTELTESGATAGTVAYMSPEQTRGEQVDQRTDLWSLGVVVYEMLTGERPFTGANDKEVMHTILHDAPEPVERLRPEVPGWLARVVQCCLDKDADGRYPDAEALLDDLEQAEAGPRIGWRGLWKTWRVAAVLLVLSLPGALYLALRPGPEAGVTRLAVLPLENRSPEAEDAYFAAGMTEELVSRLTSLSGLRVVGRTSVEHYADSAHHIAEIGKKLNVSAVLEGSVHKTGDSVRISVRLIDTASEVPLWLEDYEAEASDVPTVQRTVAEQVAEALHVQVRAREEFRLAKPETDDPLAYESYLKGRYFVHTWEDSSVVRGRDLLQQALDRDPGFARAWSGLAEAYKVRDYLGTISPEESGPRIRAAAERALALDPELAEAHAVLGTALTDYYHDWEAAGHHFRRAIELDPSSGSAFLWYAEYLRDQGYFDEALDTIDRAEAVDPLDAFYQLTEGIIYHMARRPEEALVQYERALAMRPDYPIVHFYIGLTNFQLGRYEEALAEMDIFDPERTKQDAVGLRGFTLAAMGRTAEAHAVLDELDALSEVGYVGPYQYALIYMHLGQTDRALDFFERVFEERSWFARICKVLPMLDPVRSHPRFQALLDSIGLGDS